MVNEIVNDVEDFNEQNENVVENKKKSSRRNNRKRRAKGSTNGKLRRSDSLESLGNYLDTWKISENEKVKKTIAERHAANDARRFGKAEIFAQALHAAALASDFKETGRNFQTCPANFLERSKLLALYDKHLRSGHENACETEKERIKAKIFLLRNSKPNVSFKIGIVSGVAGSGKSTLIRKLCSGSDAMCVLANPRLKETDYKGQDKTFTLQQVLLSIVPMKADIVVVDEYTLAESAEILLLQRLLQSSFVVLCGDVAQGKSDNASSLEYLQFPVIYRSTLSHRLGRNTAELCRKHGQSFEPGSKEEDEIVVADYEGETASTDKNIAFTEETVNDLKETGVEASLVLETQGKEYDSVTLFVRNCDKAAASDSHLRAVAFTRHRRKLIIRAEEEVLPCILNGEFNVKTGANSHKYGSVKYSHADNGSSET